MSEKAMIGGTPMFDNPFSHCVFLGRFGGYDLYLTNPPNATADVLARSGEEPFDYVEGLSLSYGENKPLTIARRIAEYKRLLPVNPLKALFHAHEPEDVAQVKKALVLTPEYAALLAYQAGDITEANRILDELVEQAALFALYPGSARERLQHVDTMLHMVAWYLGDTFTPGTVLNVVAERIVALGATPRAPRA